MQRCPLLFGASIYITVKLGFFPELSEPKQHIYTHILHLYTILDVLMSSSGVLATDHDPAVLSAQIQIKGSAPKIGISFNVRAVVMSRKKGNRLEGVAYMLWYFKHLNLRHRTEEDPLKRKVDHSWNVLNPYPLVGGRGIELRDSEKSGKGTW